MPNGGAFSWLANEPGSYDAMELRKRIALQLLARDGKKGYPKNIGEGLTSIGDAIGEIGMMRALERGQAAQDAAAAAKLKSVAGATDTSSPDTGDQRSDAGDEAPAVPVRTASRSPIDNPVVQDAIVRKAISDKPAVPAETTEETPPPPPAPTVVATAPPTRSVAPQSPTWTDIQVRPVPGAVRPPSPTGMPPGVETRSVGAVPSQTMPPKSWINQVADQQSPFDMPQGGQGMVRTRTPTAGLEGNAMTRAAPWLDPAWAAQQTYSPASGRVAGGHADMGLNTSGDLTSRMLQNAGTARRLADYGATRTPATSGPPTAGPPSEQDFRRMLDYGTLRSAPNTLGGSANTLALDPNITSPGGGTASPIPSTLQRPPEISPTSVAQVPPLSGAVGRQAYSPRDIADEARLSEVISGGDRGYSYAPTASLGRGGNVQSDMPPVTGVSSRVGDAVSDTVQQRRDAITKELMQQEPVKEVPQENPTQPGPTAPTTSSMSPLSTTTSEDLGSPEEAANNRPIVSDIRAMPQDPALTAGTQLAQAGTKPAPPAPPLPPADQMPPGIKPPGAPAEPVPPAPSAGRIPIPKSAQTMPAFPPAPSPPPKSAPHRAAEQALIGERNPVIVQGLQEIIKTEEAKRQDKYAPIYKDWETRRDIHKTDFERERERYRNLPQTELTLQAAEEERQRKAYEEKITRRLGGISQDTYIKNLEKGQELIKGIPSSQQSIEKARALVAQNRMYTGTFAEANTFLSKVMESAGFPRDPRASGTEQFKTYMAGVTAQARQALVGGANVSNADLIAAEKASGADAKFDPETIREALNAAERINLQTALTHQKKVRRFAGEDDPDRQAAVFESYGVPDMWRLVPQASVDKLKKFSADPQVHKDFDDTYHTPGLSRLVLQLRR